MSRITIVVLATAILFGTCCNAQTIEEVQWEDQFNSKTYTVQVTIPSTCEEFVAGTPISFNLTAPEPLQYATLYWQFLSKCNYEFCDCSEPLELTRASETEFYGSVPSSMREEGAILFYVLYQGNWETGGRHQYPEDALPHEFIMVDLPCENLVGPCIEGCTNCPN